MTGLLFHGSDVFDRGWAARFMKEFPHRRCMLAGVMARSALFDSGLQGVETPDTELSECMRMLALNCSCLVLVICSKSRKSGLALGQIVANKTQLKVPLILAECRDRIYSPLAGEAPSEILARLASMGFQLVTSPHAHIDLWKTNNTLYRRIYTAEAGDYVLLNGIYIGKAQGGDVIVGAQKRYITEVHGLNVKTEGLAKIQQIGGIDLATAKLVSTRKLRSNAINPRIGTSTGSGVALIDHVDTHTYSLAQKCAAAITIGDDTTAIAADILRRFGIPVIGIIDGDSDNLHPNGGFAPNSTVLTVKNDDDAGLLLRDTFFQNGNHCTLSFTEVKNKVLSLLEHDIIGQTNY